MHRFSIRPRSQPLAHRQKMRQKRFVKKLKLQAAPQEVMLHGALLCAFQSYRVTVCFQEPIGPYIADFFLYPLNIVVEVDGGIHRIPSVASRDKRRDTYMRNKGIKVLRFTNDEVEQDASAIAARIVAECGELPKPGDPVAVTKCPPGDAIHGKARTRKNNRIRREA